jgi:hypothetical protein
MHNQSLGKQRLQRTGKHQVNECDEEIYKMRTNGGESSSIHRSCPHGCSNLEQFEPPANQKSSEKNIPVLVCIEARRRRRLGLN